MNKGKLGPLNDSQMGQMGKHQWMFMVKLSHMGLKNKKMQPTNPNAHTYVNGTRRLSAKCKVSTVECKMSNVECKVYSVECKV